MGVGSWVWVRVRVDDCGVQPRGNSTSMSMGKRRSQKLAQTNRCDKLCQARVGLLKRLSKERSERRRRADRAEILSTANRHLVMTAKDRGRLIICNPPRLKVGEQHVHGDCEYQHGAVATSVVLVKPHADCRLWQRHGHAWRFEISTSTASKWRH